MFKFMFISFYWFCLNKFLIVFVLYMYLVFDNKRVCRVLIFFRIVFYFFGGRMENDLYFNK